MPTRSARSLREADRDLAKGLTVSDICRRRGIAETTYPPIATADGWESSSLVRHPPPVRRSVDDNVRRPGTRGPRFGKRCAGRTPKKRRSRYNQN